LNLSEINSVNNKGEDASNIYSSSNFKQNNCLNISKDFDEDIDSNINLHELEKFEDIQNIKFPDKVIMEKSATLKIKPDFPKLDMTQVYEKYQSQSNMHIVKPSKNNSIISQSNKLNSQYALAKKISPQKSAVIGALNKLKIIKDEINQSYDVINELEGQLEKVKKNFNDDQNKQIKLKEILQIADSKIENLKNQLKI